VKEASAPCTVPSKQELLERAKRLAGPVIDHHEAAAVSRAQRNQAILELDDVGVPVVEIAKAVGRSRTQVYRVIEQEHIRRHNAAADVA